MIVKPGNTGIVPQHGYDPVFPVFNLEGRGLDAGLKEVVRGFAAAVRKVMIVEKSFERVMVAMVTAGLRDIFNFHIRGERKPMLFSLGQNIFSEKILPDDGYITLLEGKIAFQRDPL
jgi:hypothetical protein